MDTILQLIAIIGGLLIGLIMLLFWVLPLLRRVLDSDTVGILRAWWLLFVALISVPTAIGYSIDWLFSLPHIVSLCCFGLGLLIVLVLLFFGDLPSKRETDYIKKLEMDSLMRATGSKTPEEALEKNEKLRKLMENDMKK